jgi:hypothetical protein
MAFEFPKKRSGSSCNATLPLPGSHRRWSGASQLIQASSSGYAKVGLYKKENPAFSGGTFKTKPMKIILQ